MKPSSPQPPTNDSLLLLAALGELPAAELAAIEQRAAVDSALAQRLCAIRADVDASDAIFATLDDVPTAMVDRAAASASASVREWQAERFSRVTQPARRASRWPQIAAIAATVLLFVAGGVIMKSWKAWTSHPNPNVANNGDDTGLPSLPSESEERDFHTRALERFAKGAEGVDWNEQIAADTPASVLPPAAPDDATDQGGIASAIATGEPFFDVPLTADADSGK